VPSSIEATTAGGKSFQGFKDFVLQWLVEKFGVEKLVAQNSRDLVQGIAAYRSEHREVDMFARFLASDVFDEVEIMFFLFVRARLASWVVHRSNDRSLPGLRQEYIVFGAQHQILTQVLAKQPASLCEQTLMSLRPHWLRVVPPAHKVHGAEHPTAPTFRQIRDGQTRTVYVCFALCAH
jgi:hypothetical protein